MTAEARQPNPAALGAITRRFEQIKAPQHVVGSFLHQYRQLVRGETGLLSASHIRPPEHIPDVGGLERYREFGRQALKKTVLIKLNGGLGTSMGLDTTKSLLPIREHRTFLDVVIGQVECIREAAGCPVPLMLMNSFNTNEETLEALQDYPDLRQTVPMTFLQNQVPKIRQDNLMPVDWPRDPVLEWCPPGHGDLYLSLSASGLLQQLIQHNLEYAFVANIDNLGATLDPAILGFFVGRSIPFLMEVTERTEADKKGGHLAVKEGRLILRESAQCPKDEEQDFQDIGKYRYFNTNNLWINLKALAEKMKQCQDDLNLHLIINRKTTDPKDPASPKVYQLETAMGAAISVFHGAQALSVPRARFSPVKTTEDLLALWSDAYDLTPEMHLTLHMARGGRPPAIRLDTRFYARLDDFKRRFPQGAPSLRECQSLTVRGDFRFGAAVVLKGNVVLENPGPGQVAIEDGAAIEG